MVSDGLVYPPTFSFSSGEQRSRKTSVFSRNSAALFDASGSFITVSVATDAVCFLNLGLGIPA